MDSDLPQLLALFQRRGRVGLASAVDEEQIRALAARPGAEPGLDAVVAIGPEGELLGWVDVYLAPGARQADVSLVLDPEADEVQLTLLIDAALDMARRTAAESMLAFVGPADSVTSALLASHGARQVAGYARLRADLQRLLAAPPLPAGWRLEPCGGATGADLAMAAIDAAWSDLPGHKPATPENVAMALEVFGPAGHLAVVDASGRAVGVVRTLLLESGEGYFDAPGLAPSVRTPMAYAALLGVAGSRLGELGASSAILESWGDPPEAREAQELLGWEIEAEELGWLLDMR